MKLIIVSKKTFYIFGSELKGNKEGVYRIRWRAGAYSALIMAPHGGFIECGTSELADSVADTIFWFYAFEGINKKNNFTILHIPSTAFNESIWHSISSKVNFTLAIHGIKGDIRDPILIGGRDLEGRDEFCRIFSLYGFRAIACSGGPYGGIHPDNVVNRNAKGMGIQIEIPRGLRNAFLKDSSMYYDFVAITRSLVYDRLERSSSELL